MFDIVQRVPSIVSRGLQAARSTISRMTKAIAHGPVLATVADLARSKPQLVAENLLLRQQLVVLHRSVKRPQLTPAERGLVVLLASRVKTWKHTLLIVKPETVLHWHRQGFRLFWKRKSHARSRDPKVPSETISLIQEMAANNRLWGAERIRGELLKVGIKVAIRTIQRYMRHARPPRPHGQSWATCLRNHAADTWSCDFLQIHDVFFRSLFTCFITELGSRRIVHVRVTRAPTDEWAAQQLREATPFGDAPQYLLRDNDAKHGSHCTSVATGTGIEVLRTPIKVPRANAICERLLGSVRRECLNHILLVSEAQLRRILKEYVMYFNRSRPHQGIDQRVPDPDERGGQAPGAAGHIVAFPVLGGLHHEYRKAA